MNRRALFKGLAAVGAGLILPPTLAENAEVVFAHMDWNDMPSKRYWALGEVPKEREWFAAIHDISTGESRILYRDEMDFSFMDRDESPWGRIDYDEAIHTVRMLEERFYPLRSPARLLVRAVDGATMVNAGFGPVDLIPR